MAKRLILVMLLCSLLLGCAQGQPEETAVATAAAQTSVPATVATVPETTVPQTTEPQPERFLLTFVGDCTFGGPKPGVYAQNGFVNTIGEDYSYPFRHVIDYFANDEATFLNLEGPLCDTERPQDKTYVFRGPSALGAILPENSVEVVSVANNHTMDHGQQGYDATLALLEELNISYIQEQQGKLITTRNGLTIGVYGAVYYDLDVQTITDGIRTLAAQEPDVLIFAPHWGTEGAYYPTWMQEDLAHAVIDAGADIVWGSHPHILQPVEQYNGGVIIYSAANFSFGGNTAPRDYDTVLIQQEIIRDTDGSVTLGELILVPCAASGQTDRNNFQPVPYELGSEGYERTMQKLNGTWPVPYLPSN